MIKTVLGAALLAAVASVSLTGSAEARGFGGRGFHGGGFHHGFHGGGFHRFHHFGGFYDGCGFGWGSRRFCYYR
ncbi:hypothetical protein [Methylobacterium crusticola]|uniref:hypothetical protein n=1 Tax=Methylobacterium crusticola TaxID=1697972 RepID=UPI000FFC6CD9|nr:hypothetical protein [Methylobacterium crusticola]